MDQITVESPIGERLSHSTGQVAVCDVEGRVIGFFSPVKGRPRLEELQLEPPRSISETEELRKKNRSGKPLEEILGRLGLMPYRVFWALDAEHLLERLLTTASNPALIATAARNIDQQLATERVVVSSRLKVPY